MRHISGFSVARSFASFVAGALVFLTACSGGSGSSNAASASRAPSVLALTADMTSGKTLYTQECASCHGADGRSGSAGRNIVGAGANRTASQVLTGGDGMPSFDNLSDQQIADIVGYAESLLRETSGFRLQASGFRLQASGFRLRLWARCAG